MEVVKEIYTSKNPSSLQTVRSKGDRLGWKHISRQKQRPLKAIVGIGKKIKVDIPPSLYNKKKLLVP